MSGLPRWLAERTLRGSCLGLQRVSGGARDTNEIAMRDPVRRALDDAILRGEAGRDLDDLAEIACDCNRLEDNAIVQTDRCDTQAPLIENQRARRHIGRDFRVR